MSHSVDRTPEPQAASAVLMVRPACFGFNPQTAASNSFQQPGAASEDGNIAAAALREFDGLADLLDRAGVQVITIEDTPLPPKPDALFPNNWVSFHHDGTAVLYPMLAVNRRMERREDILELIGLKGAFHIARTVDLSYRERAGKFLEGTGSLVLDRANRVAYACVSPRTDLDVLGEFAQALDYELVTFDAIDAGGRAVYHTNVLMAVGTDFAVVCADSIATADHRAAVLSKLRATHHDVVEISRGQMASFAGNILELATPSGAVIAMSSNALSSLDRAQRRTLEGYGALVAGDIGQIECFGGGGVRCMLAEVHLPLRRSP